MSISLWGVVAVQTLIVSWLLLALARHLLGPAYSLRAFAVVMLLLGTATSAGWFAGQIMPDIFSAILLLACLVLSVAPTGTGRKIGLYVLMLGCILMHNSNLLIALLMGVILFIQFLRSRKDYLRRAAIALTATSVIGWIALSSMNAIAGRGFTPSTASHVFLMSRMVENGIMDDFLDDYCPADSNAYNLCAYRNKLPRRQWDFMWDVAGPLYTTGGWQANEEEYGRIIRKTLTTPKYIALHAIKAGHATLRQLPLIYVGDGLMAYEITSSPEREIYNHLKGEEKEFNSSAQQNRSLHLEWWNPFIILFSLISMIVALLIPARHIQPGTGVDFRRILWLMLPFLLINAGVTATLATVIGRYESRVFWMLPFLSILYILRSFYHRNTAAA
jgi:hypothetical protein